MKDCSEIKRVVVKVGTSTLAYSTGLLNLRRIKQLVEVISDLKNTGLEIVLVSSGAIGVGAGELGFSGRPHDMPTIQACASVGQCELMQGILQFLFGVQPPGESGVDDPLHRGSGNQLSELGEYPQPAAAAQGHSHC